MLCPNCGSHLYVTSSESEKYKVFRDREYGGCNRKYETKETIFGVEVLLQKPTAEFIEEITHPEKQEESISTPQKELIK